MINDPPTDYAREKIVCQYLNDDGTFKSGAVSEYDSSRTYSPEEACCYRGHTWSHIHASVASCNAGELICTISSRGYYKTTNEPSYIGYCYDGTMTGVLLVGKTATSVGYYTSESVHFDTGTPFVYNGETWFWNGGNYSWAGDLLSTAGKAIYKAAGSTTQEGLAGIFLDYVTGKTPGTNYTVWGVDYTNPNALDNWYYGNPVNQRGLTTYANTSTAGYTIDRWKVTQATLSIITGGIRLVNASSSYYNFVQFVENPSIYSGKQVTLSMKIKISGGTLRYGIKANGADFGYNYVDTTNTGIVSNTCTLPTGLTELYIFLIPQTVGGTFEIESIKLELGPISTLSNDSPPNYGEELAKCQRFGYMWKQYSLYPGVQYSADYIDFCIPLPVAMRITPSIVNGDLSVNGMHTGWAFAMATTYNNASYLRLRATKSTHGITNSAYLEVDSDCFLSSDL
jgi:hypothetical protein